MKQTVLVGASARVYLCVCACARAHHTRCSAAADVTHHHRRSLGTPKEYIDRQPKGRCTQRLAVPISPSIFRVNYQVNFTGNNVNLSVTIDFSFSLRIKMYRRSGFCTYRRSLVHREFAEKNFPSLTKMAKFTVYLRYRENLPEFTYHIIGCV